MDNKIWCHVNDPLDILNQNATEYMLNILSMVQTWTASYAMETSKSSRSLQFSISKKNTVDHWLISKDFIGCCWEGHVCDFTKENPRIHDSNFRLFLASPKRSNSIVIWTSRSKSFKPDAKRTHIVIYADSIMFMEGSTFDFVTREEMYSLYEFLKERIIDNNKEENING